MSNKPQTTSTATGTVDGANTLRTFIYVVGVFLLIGTVWLICTDTYSAANVRRQCFNTTDMCCHHWDTGREHAEQIGTQFALYWAQLQSDPAQFKDAFADLFERHHGVYSTVDGNFYGDTNIQGALQTWLSSTSDSAITISIERMFWDAETRTLSINWIWAANSQYFYTQDQFIIIRFDCDFKVVYYRGYFDVEQSTSTFTNDYARACGTCLRKPREHHEHHRPTVPPTSIPMQAPIIG